MHALYSEVEPGLDFSHIAIGALKTLKYSVCMFGLNKNKDDNSLNKMNSVSHPYTSESSDQGRRNNKTQC